MARKGLIFRIAEVPGKPTDMASQFIPGIWESHVNELDPEIAADVSAYKLYLRETVWKPSQLRTIPVGQRIPHELEVMTYGKADAWLDRHDRFSITPCIYRKEKNLIGEGCDRPETFCLGFGLAVAYVINNGVGRACDKPEILEVLHSANEHALVPQPSNSQEIDFFSL
jgi:hypothetical protein